MGRTADYSKQTCAVAATLEVVGHPWTLLILRDAFQGIRRFEQWQDRLGVARNVLAARLKALVENGVLTTRLYSERPPRKEYLLTPKGRDLRAVLLTMADWGDKHVYGEGGGPHIRIHDSCGQVFKPKLVCEACGETLAPGDITHEFRHAEHMTVADALAASKA
jgi:DNA-binding HxlR family transcriptional regulator